MLSIPYHSKSKYEKFGYNDELEKRMELLGKLSSQQLSDRPGMTHVLHYFFFILFLFILTTLFEALFDWDYRNSFNFQLCVFN